MYISTFNYTYFLLIFFIILVVTLTTILFKNKQVKNKKTLLLALCIFNIVFFIVYKISLAIGSDDLARHGYHFNIWTELPMHLCNVSLFLVPIGLLLNKESIYAYGFYVAPLGAFMAITFPNPYFTNTNLLFFYNIGFYFTHINIIIIGLLICTLGFFKPNFKSIPFLFILVFSLACGSFLINLGIRFHFKAPANYFFTYEPEGISILELFWKILPIRFLYVIFALVILGVYTSLVTLPFYLVERQKNKKMVGNYL